MMTKNDEQIEDLQCGGLKIIQNKKLYNFTSDAVILANFVKLKPREVAVEIGGGSGVVSILASSKNKVKEIKIFEIQEELQKICQKNIKLNNLGENLTLICDDVKNFDRYIARESIDVVFSNPPYFHVDNECENMVKKIARQEVCLNLENLIFCTSKMLKFGGRFYVVYPAERSAELVTACQNARLAAKRLFFTENGKGKATLVVLEAIKGASNGVKILPTLQTNDKDGNFLEELKTRKFL